MVKGLKGIFVDKNSFAFLLKRYNPTRLTKKLRELIAYCLIFSLLWQNCLWAVKLLDIIEENIEGAKTRAYGSQRIGIVAPGPVKNGAIHNIFENFQLLNGSGVVFQGTPQAQVIYNRVYNDSPLHLSGFIAADTAVPVVFANPGGIVLENPDFKGIPHVSLVAGSMAQTSKGMAYGIDQGSITLKQSLIEEQNDLQSISLTGRKIHIQHSLLSSSECIALRSGQHIRSMEDEESFSLPKNEQPQSQEAITLDRSSILRSKGICLESYDENASINLLGLIQSTEGDIVIRALGDIYIDKLLANRNLNIETTGRVFFKDKASVGGTVTIKASHIYSDKDLIAKGRLFLQAAYDLLFKGNVRTEDHLEITGKDLVIEGKVSAQKGSSLSLEKFTNKGLFSVFGTGLQGIIQYITNEGKIDLSNLKTSFKRMFCKIGSVLRTRGNAILQGLHYRNEGKVFTCGIHQATLEGSHDDTGMFYCPTLFLLKARDVGYFPGHKSFLKDGVINGTYSFRAGESVSFVLKGNQFPCLFQINGGSSLSFNGQIRQFASSPFPLLDFFGIFDSQTQQAPLSYQDFAKEVSRLTSGEWEKIKRSVKPGIILKAEKGSIDCQKAVIDPESADISLVAEEKINTDKANIKSGFFKGNIASIRSKNAALKDSTLSSLFGSASLLTKDSALLTNSHVQGGEHTEVISNATTLEKSTVKSDFGNAIVQGLDKVHIDKSFIQAPLSAAVQSNHVAMAQSKVESKGNAIITGNKSTVINDSILSGEKAILNGGKELTLSASTFQAKDTTSVKAQTANINKSSFTAKTNIIEGEKALTLTLNTLESEYNKLTSPHLTADSTNIKGETFFEAQESLNLHDSKAEDTILAKSGEISFSGNTTAKSLITEAIYIKNRGDIDVKEETSLKGSVVEQLGTTRSGKKIYIEASQQYLDSPNAYNEAQESLTLIAENSHGFKGRQKADTAIIKLRDMQLLDLLNKTKARITEVHLKEADVNIDEDTIVNTTLYLWAQNLKTKAKFTVNGDFMARIQERIMSQGLIAANGLDLQAKQIIAETPVRREFVSGGYREYLQPVASFWARTGNLKMHAEELFSAHCANFKAKLSVKLTSGHKLILGVQQVTTDISHQQKRHKFHYQSRENYGVRVEAEEQDVTIKQLDPHGEMIFEKLTVKAGRDIDTDSKGTFRDKSVEAVNQTTNEKKKKKRFKGSSKRTEQMSSTTSETSVYIAGRNIKIISDGNFSADTPTLKSKTGAITIGSLNKTTYFNEVKDHISFSKQKAKKNTFIQSNQNKGRIDETIKKKSFEAPQGTTVLGKIVDSHLPREEHRKWNRKQRSLTPAASAVVTLASSIAIAVTGPFGLTGAYAYVASASCSTLATQTVHSIVAHNGNFAKIGKDLIGTDNLKNIGISAAAAAATYGFLDQAELLGKAAQGIKQHAIKGAINASVGSGSAIIQGEDVRKAVFQGMCSAVINAIGGYAAEQIGANRNDLGYVGHKLTHGALGALMGMALSKDRISGAFAGAISATIVEITAEALAEDVGAKARDIELKKALTEGRQPSEESYRAIVYGELNKYADYGKFLASIIALGVNQDVDISLTTAENAVRNNFIPTALLAAAADGLTAAKIAWEIYAITHEEQIEATKQEICNIVAKKVGCNPKTVETIYDAGMVIGSTGNAVKKGVKTGWKFGRSKFQSSFGLGKEKPISQPTQSSTSKIEVPTKKAEVPRKPLEPAKKQKGVNHPNTKKSLEYGNKKHKEFTENAQKLLTLDKKRIRYGESWVEPDANAAIVHELKPGTVTGVKKGLKQLQKYQDASKKQGVIHLYKPEGKSIDLDTIVRRNFKDDPVVQKVLQDLKK